MWESLTHNSHPNNRKLLKTTRQSGQKGGCGPVCLLPLWGELSKLNAHGQLFLPDAQRQTFAESLAALEHLMDGHRRPGLENRPAAHALVCFSTT